jgi:hypothetical protein
MLIPAMERKGRAAKKEFIERNRQR